uniref:COP9 signalosome complex subunit 6 n=1 Tax=Hemiselmis andersenii TaxID=464988 RepID=A0A7S1HE50_HEMAN
MASTTGTMETDDEPQANAAGVKTGGLNIDIHPLVIVNISDHGTRKKSLAKGKGVRVLGILLGIQEGRDVEICNSFELDYKIVNGSIQLNKDSLEVKAEQYKKVFDKYEPLGWYSNSPDKVPLGEVLEGDLQLHKQIAAIYENPLYLLLDTSMAPGARELPLQIFESELHIIDDTPTFTLAKSTYKLKSEDAERISVDQVSRLSQGGAGSGSSALSSHLNSLNSAITMLQKRVLQILKPLEGMERGEIPMDHNMLRQVQALCNRLPTVDTTEFDGELLEQQRDALLVAYLGAMTKGTNTANEVTDKYNLAFERQSRRRGLF